MKTFKKDMEVIINTVDKEKLPSYKRLLTEEYWKIPDEQLFQPFSQWLAQMDILERLHIHRSLLIRAVPRLYKQIQ